MHKAFPSIIIILLIALTGCASELRRPSIDWRYERDELGIVYYFHPTKRAFDSDYEGTVILDAIEGILIGGRVKDRIELSPDELKHIIYIALTDYARTENKAITATSADDSVTTLWNILEPKEGKFVTDWRPILGKQKGFLRWKKIYQTEVRHLITIMRSYRSPNHTNFSIHTEVRERPNSNYKWSSGDPELGRASFNEIKNMLLKHIHRANQKAKIRTKGDAE